MAAFPSFDGIVRDVRKIVSAVEAIPDLLSELKEITELLSELKEIRNLTASMEHEVTTMRKGVDKLHADVARLDETLGPLPAGIEAIRAEMAPLKLLNRLPGNRRAAKRREAEILEPDVASQGRRAS